MKLAVVGAAGRMGRAVVRLAREAGDLRLVGACDGPQSSFIGLDAGELAGSGVAGVAVSADVADALLGAEVCVDFSSPAATVAVARAVARQRVAWVCGTTGLDPAAQRALEEAAASTAVLWAPNTSLGVQVLADLVREAARMLGLGYDIEIVETHHRKKADAPSGTARRLAEAVEEARSGLRPVTGREGRPGPRRANELGVLALRGGDVIGDHTVHFLGDGERLELTHRATDRDVFAHGALRAARFLAGKPAGLYSIRDVLSAAPLPLLH